VLIENSSFLEVLVAEIIVKKAIPSSARSTQFFFPMTSGCGLTAQVLVWLTKYAAPYPQSYKWQ